MQDRIRPGKRAPDFVGETFDGKRFHFYKYLGNPTWIIFYRYPECPFCNLHLFSIQKREQEFLSQNLQIVCVFQSPKEAFRRSKATRKIPKRFALLADPDRKIFDLYETEKRLGGLLRPKVATEFVRAAFNGFFQGRIQGDLGQLPAHILVDEEGRIVDTYFGKHIADHIAWESVQRFLHNRTSPGWNPLPDTQVIQADPEISLTRKTEVE
jgi:thioredoxin-dependent peroxiredoxin